MSREITDGEQVGRGEAAGVYYLGDDQQRMLDTIEQVRAADRGGITREELQVAASPVRRPQRARLRLVGAGGQAQRNAGVAARRAFRDQSRCVTTFTLPADDPSVLATKVDRLSFAKAIKLKLDGDLDVDRERMRVVRRLGQTRGSGWTRTRVSYPPISTRWPMLAREHSYPLIEQPLKRGDEAALEGWRPGVPVAADESILDLAELQMRAQYFDVINIKLDKCGGLTEALKMARAARLFGKQVMVGNMGGSTLAMAPGFVLGQLCDVADLDGPYGLAEDSLAAQIYSGGNIFVPEEIWGGG